MQGTHPTRRKGSRSTGAASSHGSRAPDDRAVPPTPDRLHPHPERTALTVWEDLPNRPFWLISLILGHLVLGLLPKGSFLGTLHALGTLGGSLLVVLLARRPVVALYASAYITGAEVFWRMISAGVFHEYGKYAVCLVLIAGLIKHGQVRFPILQVVYFLCLVPGVFMTLYGYEWYTSRRLTSQNLSGPVALLICSIYCQGMTINKREMCHLLLALLLPLSVAALYVLKSMQISTIEWSNESNSSLSGGFGPNQVSAMLGLGAFAAVWFCFLTSSLVVRVFMGGLCLWLLGQSALTFSRTGIYLVVGSSLASGAILMRNPRIRRIFAMSLTALVLFGALVIYPVLNNFTEGRLAARFSETQLSNRGEIASVDLTIWERHLILGVGIGQAKFERGRLMGEEAAAHTEYTRLLAEHGLLGLAAMFLLVFSPLWNLLNQRKTGQALCAGFVAWSLAFMLASAMRLAGPSVLLGLSFAKLSLEDPVVPKRPSTLRSRI